MQRLYFLLAGCSCFWQVTAQQRPLPFTMHKQVVIAHRGDHTSLPENTLAAYESAIQLGADYIETDVRTTKDDSLVIMHNASVRNKDGSTTAIRDLTYFAVKSIVVGDTVRGQRYSMPSFREVLQLCRNRVRIYLDFKDADVAATYQLIKEAGMERQVVVYANNLNQLQQWHQLAPVMPVIGSVPDSITTVAALCGFLDRYPHAGVDGRIGQYSPALLQVLKQRNVAVWLDVQQKSEGPDTWQKAIAEGVDGMQTDRPDALIGYLKQHTASRTPMPVDAIINDFYYHPERILVVAHRADHTQYPENSLAAIQKAITAGIDIVELDVRETKDKVLVIMHDKEIKRTTNGKGLVSDFTYAQLQAFRLLQNGTVTHEHIPTLEEVLQLTKGKIMVDIDFKADTHSALIETYRLLKVYDMQRQVLFFVYDYKDAAGCQALDGTVPVMPRVHNAVEVRTVLQAGGFPVMHIDDSFYTDTLMQQVRSAGIRIWSNALGDYDDKEEVTPGAGFTTLLDTRSLVNVVQTNYPEYLLAFLRKKGWHR